MNNIEEIMKAISIGFFVAAFLLNTGRALKAIKLCKENLVLLNNKVPSLQRQIGQKIYRAIYEIMFMGYRRISDNTNAITCGRKLLAIYRERGDIVREGYLCMVLAKIYFSQYKYAEAKELWERTIIIVERETGARKVEAMCYGNLGFVFESLGQYIKAREFLEKALSISMEINYTEGAAICYRKLGTVFLSLCKYVKANEYLEKALAIRRKISDRAGEASCYGSLGTVFQSLGQNVKAKEYYEKALAIRKKIGDKREEGADYGNLGILFTTLGDYDKAKEYIQKALAIAVEIGDRAGEASCYGNLGTVFQSLGQYFKAKEYYEKALAITKKLGNKVKEATDYDNLGTLFQSLGQYVKAKEYHEKALAITTNTGYKKGEATNYRNLGAVFQSLGEYENAKEYLEKALKIKMEIGDKQGEATVYSNLAGVCGSLSEYEENKEYYDKALAIFTEIGDKAGEATIYGNLGVLFQSLGDNVIAKEYFEKSLAISLEIGDRKGEAANYIRQGSVFLHTLDEYVMAEQYFEKALSIAKYIGYAEIEFQCYLCLTFTKLLQEKLEEASSYLSQSIERYEDLRRIDSESDHIKISLADKHSFSYQLLSRLFCRAGYPKNALNVVELGRARALADLMATQYSVKKHISADKLSCTAIENVIKNESNCTCLYISYYSKGVSLWLLKKNGAIHFRNIKVEKKALHTRLAKAATDVHEFFAIMAESFRSFGILPNEVCEDRSLNDIEPKLESCHDESLKPFLRGKDKGDPKPSLTLFYEMLINPVSDLLDEPEIIIVPDRGLYRVPFPALLDENGKYLSETFRIRVVPSLTTLKLIQDSPADYHSQTGALVVGDPEVGVVIYRGRVNRKFVPLPGARKEAEMIGGLLGVQPLLGQHATKQTVLEKINSASLIHIAAHGNSERGEIALAPPDSTTRIPKEDDYLLKMSDISEVQVRAKLVVLSCCHSGRGQIRAEGVVGIARAFLGSGARSVLVALWALEDSATEQFMSRFYEHLVRGESVSESLYEAMKWMRENGFSKVKEWAPFMLIGDNVSFIFGK